MACQSVLIVGGRIDEESSQEKLCKLLYDGLVAAFGGDLDNLDAQFLNCSVKPLNSVDSKECKLYASKCYFAITNICTTVYFIHFMRRQNMVFNKYTNNYCYYYRGLFNFYYKQ
ncbi:Microtubule-associated protein [Schistosoma japonicum]|nr:Microtubule-associated protein [Schistosoma japonicum]